MENAQLISLSRQMALQRQMDVVANNLANINTTGFKSENILFEEYKSPTARDRDFAFKDQILSYTQDWATVRDMTQGAFQQTGNPFDLALSGDGYFVVQTPAGERYSKAGSFQLAADGTLVDLNGNPVLTEGGPVKFDGNVDDITINGDGSITTSQSGRGRLRVVEFANVQDLEHVGDNLFTGPAGQQAANTRVIQGVVEKSNVSGVNEMAEMIRVSRAYESLSNLMQQQNDLRKTAIQRLGDTQA